MMRCDDGTDVIGAKEEVVPIRNRAIVVASIILRDMMINDIICRGEVLLVTSNIIMSLWLLVDPLVYTMNTYATASVSCICSEASREEVRGG